ncbi:MAG: glycoside hydrolase family 13 protein [Aggregatilineales bacterium]
MTIHTPDWVKNAVFYQIFPDRFARSERMEHPRGITFKEWGASPAEQGYQGGDLYGVVDKLDYLQELGITAIYLNPIFSSASNHRYHTYDYMQVDPLLGGDAALRELLDEAHKRDIKVILDGVFNHASRGFWAFHHILEEGGNSPYIDWFFIDDFPLNPYPRSAEETTNYGAWWNLAALPKFNTDNPGVRDYIYDVARHWLEFGIDGWRLDVPYEIDDDAFWQGFRKVVKETNPEAYIVGEVWETAQRWLQGDQFDAVMNYLFMWTAESFAGANTLADYPRDHLEFAPLDAKAYADKVDWMYGLYDWEINYAQLNMLDSHDTARALWIMGEDKSALKLTTLLHMTMPGAPNIYYGSEIGMSGADDPFCRGAFPWQDDSVWDHELLAFYKAAIALRNTQPVLRTGTFKRLYAEGMVYGFHRELNGTQAIVIVNAGESDATITVNLPENAPSIWAHLWEQSGSINAQTDALVVDVPARSGAVFISKG